jgi:four helix bundle protein
MDGGMNGGGGMRQERKGMMRGYKKLRVWQDAKALYVLTWKVFKKFPMELSRIRSQQLASVDSVHRNISEAEFEEMDALAWKLENGLKKLVESLQEKRSAEWSDTFLVKESNEIHTTAADIIPPQ